MSPRSRGATCSCSAWYRRRWPSRCALFVREPERWQHGQGHSRACGCARSSPGRCGASRCGACFVDRHRADHMVEQQRLHPHHRHRPGAGREAGVRGLTRIRRRWPWSKNWKLKANLYFNFGGLVGTLLVDPAGEDTGPARAVRAVFRRSAVAMLAAFGLDMAPETRLTDVLRDRRAGVRHLRRLPVLPAGAVPDAPACHRLGLLLQHRPAAGGRGSVRRRQHGREGRGAGRHVLRRASCR